MPCYRLEGVTPVVDPSAYVHPTAVLIGDVIVGPGVYVGPNACLRGDFGRLILEKGANIQDTCVMHGFPGTDTVVEEDGHIGHGAVLHGCRVGRNALIGMNAVIMDGAVIGEASIVAATAFVKAGFECAPRSLVVGAPAEVKRQLSEQEIAWKVAGTQEYQRLVTRCHDSLQECVPLTQVEAQRPRVNAGEVKPKYQTNP
ncbi:phenylacetic acid degradation protein [Allopseudospirillum japonicum]|uniref:Phenylacetic acid degradation protein n=1 Tax=Allopseudospirillum japonicum TaxID=64971 RepID=A0A1H6SRX1_9GAMM|nr:phenylacetic acid degradation protein PaaY [Allopseudospirillum japonicum]SEI70643.1 phenylacetic acid degradation protein [Allopseudospirillum japonicum]